MTTAQMTEPKTLETSKHTRLVSFENSNSWIKRHDLEGTLLIQSGYVENPGKMAKGDDENPIVMVGASRRWYGSRACIGNHNRIHGRSKIDSARDSFSACLRPSDDGKDLIVIASHWDFENLESLEAALKGQYNVTRNGVVIRCAVTKVLPVLEGIGSYQSLKPQLEEGYSLLIEIGYGTAEEWLIDDSGEVVDGRPVTALGVSKLVDTIANDPTVKAILGGDESTSINLSMISAGLKSDTCGKITAGQWLPIKRKYVTAWFEALQAYITTQYETQGQNISNVILTGGGAALLKSVKPEVTEYFTIPLNPQTASVMGAFNHQWSKV